MSCCCDDNFSKTNRIVLLKPTLIDCQTLFIDHHILVVITDKPSTRQYGRMDTGVSTKISCSYRNPENNDEIDCESTNFTALIFNQCNVEVNYKYTVFNNSSQTVNVISLVDESFQNNIDESFILPSRTEFLTEVKDDIDICTYSKITKQVALIGQSIGNNGTLEKFPLAPDTITFRSP